MSAHLPRGSAPPQKLDREDRHRDADGYSRYLLSYLQFFALEDLWHFAGRYRAAKQIALGLAAGRAQYKLGLLLGLHALRQCRDSQIHAERRDGTNDGVAFIPAAKFTHERLVDLDPVKRELLQVMQR